MAQNFNGKFEHKQGGGSVFQHTSPYSCMMYPNNATYLILLAHNYRDQPILYYYFCLLCYTAVFLKFTYYAQEQELLSDYYVIYI